MTETAIKKGARLCYMHASLDESVSAWNNCRKTEDFDLYDWKQEVQKLSRNQQMPLFDSPLGVEEQKEDEEDSVASEVYDIEVAQS